MRKKKEGPEKYLKDYLTDSILDEEKVSIACKTKAELKILFKILDDKGYKWCSKESYLDPIQLKDVLESSVKDRVHGYPYVICAENGTFNATTQNGYTVYPFEDITFKTTSRKGNLEAVVLWRMPWQGR